MFASRQSATLRSPDRWSPDLALLVATNIVAAIENRTLTVGLQRLSGSSNNLEGQATCPNSPIEIQRRESWPDHHQRFLTITLTAANTVFLPSNSLIRRRWLHFARANDRRRESVLIWLQFVARGLSAMVASLVSSPPCRSATVASFFRAVQRERVFCDAN